MQQLCFRSSKFLLTSVKFFILFFYYGKVYNCCKEKSEKFMHSLCLPNIQVELLPYCTFSLLQTN